MFAAIFPSLVSHKSSLDSQRCWPLSFIDRMFRSFLLQSRIPYDHHFKILSHDLIDINRRNVYQCYGEICNYHRNSLNKGPCQRSPDRETRRDTLDRTREELHTLSLCKYYNKLLLYLFKPIVNIISFISFHGILSLDYPYIIATSGYISIDDEDEIRTQ